ncbi:hypothetical protein [Nocardioides rubriscoriae]|uniref:hypothetical protein n=1 Tax=Nocardioides rubriscoriae TaxID=642762 RepID=UPI0011DF5C4D|nr:hypothetical protein [Nocardioides rubriscoriae]
MSTAQPSTTPDHQTTDTNRSTTVNTMHEDHARAQMSARLGEAREMRTGHQLARARRLSRKAERAAQQARLALARAL